MGQIIFYVLFTIAVLYLAKSYLDKKGHPKALFYLFFAEMWERFSFYGMRALLTLYLIKDYYSHLENNEEIAYGIYAAYGALVYLTPLIGGYLADKFIGYRKSIVYGGVLMALGHFFMAFPTDFFFYGALGLLIMGNGFFKPNISTLVGSLYEEGDVKRDGGFTIFYMGINLGAMIAPLFCGYLGETYGWHWGFGAAGLGMLAGLVVFWKGVNADVLGDKGLQPSEYKTKKILGLSISNLIYTLGFVAVPVFAYLIILDTQSEMLGDVLKIVGAIVLIYVFYLVYGFKSGNPDSFKINNLFSFKGRIRRSQYWIALIIIGAAYSLLFFVLGLVEPSNRTLEISLQWLLVLGVITLTWVSIAQATKRCHDRNNSGWWQLIPFYGLWLLFGDGNNETNDYGVNVKENNIENNKSADRLVAIMILAVFCTIFWACFEQAGSSITVWVDKCVNLVGMNASQTNAINPFYIVLLAIPFSWIWTKLGALNKNPNTPMKFALGIFQLGIGFLIFASTAHFIGENGKVPFLFVFLGYFLITTGELFLSPIGLSKVTELAPKKIAAFIMGVWFLSSTFAHYISGIIAKLTTGGNTNMEGNWLTDLSNWFMGNPVPTNESIATLLQYNNVYAQIGFVTIFIAIFVVIISPYIKKLMHGIH